MDESVHFLNGKLVKEQDLVVPIRDLGYARGYAVFDFLVTYPSKRPFMLEKHIDRLFNSATQVGLEIPWGKDEVSNWVKETLQERGGGEKAIKIILSGGVSHTLLPEQEPTLAIVIDPRHEYPPEYYQEGIAVITNKFTRHQPTVKSNNYIEGVRQMQIAAKKGAVEPIYYDDAQVFEGATCNIFALIEGELLTPKSNILPGITRGVLLDILKLDVPIKVADFPLERLMSADEAFLTASNKEVMPVVRVDGSLIGDGKVGKITKEVMRQFHEFTHGNAWQ